MPGSKDSFDFSLRIRLSLSTTFELHSPFAVCYFLNFVNTFLRNSEGQFTHLFRKIESSWGLWNVWKYEITGQSNRKRNHSIDNKEPMMIFSLIQKVFFRKVYHCQPRYPPIPPRWYTAAIKYPENIVPIALLVWNMHDRFASSSFLYQEPITYCIPG